MLRGRRIGLTREWKSFELMLQDRGASVEIVALTRIAPPTLTTGIDLALVNGLDDYQWVGFTSANAVTALLQRVEVEDLAACRLAAVGSATATALEEAGVSAELVATTQTGLGLAEALSEQPPSSILLPTAERGRTELAEHLSAAGWDVIRANAYSTEAVALSDKDIARMSSCDVLCLLAPSAVSAWASCSKGNLDQPPLAAIGPTTAAAIKTQGFTLFGVASQPTPESLLELLQEKF